MARFRRAGSKVSIWKGARPKSVGIAAQGLAFTQGQARDLGQGLEAKRGKSRAAVGPDQGPGVIGGQIVDQPRGDEAGGQLASTFAKDARKAAGREGVQGGAWVNLATRAGVNLDQGGACCGPCGAGRLGSGDGVNHPDRGLAGGLTQAAGRSMGKAAVEHDTQGLPGCAHVAHSQVWIIGAGGASTDHHRIMRQA